MLANYIIYYILAGTVFNIFYDLLVDYLRNRGIDSDIRFTLKERIIATLLWPIYATGLIVNIFINLFKK
jgi:Trk-type K+ transport system membrane component